MFSSRHCPRSDFSPTKPDPHVLTVTWDLLLAFLPPSVKGRQRRAHLASPCSKGFVHCSFCPKHSVIGVGTSSITTIQVSTKENLKKGSNYSGLGQLSPASCSFLTQSPRPALLLCSTKPTTSQPCSAIKPANLSLRGLPRVREKKRGLVLSFHKRIPGSETFHKRLGCFCFHPLHQTHPHGFGSDCKNGRSFPNVFCHILSSLLRGQNNIMHAPALPELGDNPSLIGMHSNRARGELLFLETRLLLLASLAPG